MSARPCQIALHECIGVDSPITGFSSEDADPVLYYAQCGLFYNPYTPPPLGGGIATRTDYSTIVFAGESQAEVDAWAANQCSPVATGQETYSSEAVTVSGSCIVGRIYLTDDLGNIITDDEGNRIVIEDGTDTTFTVTIPAGYIAGVPGQSQAEVNALATAEAYTQLNTNMEASGCTL